MMQENTDTETPIARKISKFSKKLLYVVLALAALNFLVGLSPTESWVSMESILKRCDRAVNAEGQLESKDRDRIERKAEAVAKQGLRILAFAKKSVSAGGDSLDRSDIDRNLVFLGLQGTIDPPRTSAIEAVRACQSAGITIKMIAGDRALTASQGTFINP